jgi:alpha-1,2-mannosyltransferase
MIGQSIGGMLLGLEALILYTPHIYVDSMGYSFTFCIFRWLGGCRVGCYVHYPTISTDMLGRVAGTTAESSATPTLPLKARAKLVYYRAFALVYGLMGARADVVVANSSWTGAHIRSLWKPRSLAVVYPPCNTQHLLMNPLQVCRHATSCCLVLLVLVG